MTRPVTDPLAEVDEASFRTGVLIPLLRAMGYRDVEHFHGRDELGKDIVAWRSDADGTRENVAVVAKVGPINASISGDAGTVPGQIRQALGSIYTDPRTGEERRAHRVIVATTGAIRDASRKAILSQLDRATERAIRFWSGGTVRELLDEYLPDFDTPNYLPAFYRRASDLDHFDVSATVDTDGILYTIAPRKDGATVARGVLTFPETPEGDAILAAFDRHVEAGEPVTIPASFVESFNLHPELEALLGPGGPADLVLGAGAPDETVSVEVDGTLGPLRVRGLPIATAQMGTRRGEFTTDADAHPFALELQIERVEGGVQIRTRAQIDPAGHPVRDALQAMRVWDAIGAGSSIRMVLDGTGDTLAELGASAHTHKPHPLASYLDDLAALERFLGEIVVPETLTETDIPNAALLRSILTTGVGTRPFHGITLIYAPGDENVDAYLRFLSSGEPIWMRELRPAPRFALARHDIALGPSHALFQITLDPTEADRVRSRLAEGDVPTSIRFDAAGSCQRVTVYRDHLPPALRERYEELRDRMPPLLDWSRLPGDPPGDVRE